MITEGPDGFGVVAVLIPAAPSRTDPLAQRGHLGIKFIGGLSSIVGAGGVDSAVIELRDEIARRCEAGLREALKRPLETVTSFRASA